MKHLECVRLVLICMVYTGVISTQDKTDRSKNPDILKEFRTFADTVIPQGGTKRNVTAPVEETSSGDDENDDTTVSDEEARLNKDSKDVNAIAEALATARKDAPGSLSSDANGNVQKSATNPLASVLAGSPTVKNNPVNVQKAATKSTGKALSTAKPDTDVAKITTTQTVSTFQQNPMAIPAGSPLATKDIPEPITGIQSSFQRTASNPPEAVINKDQVNKKPKKLRKAQSKNGSVAKPSVAATGNATTVNEKTKKPSETLHNYQDDDDVDTYVDEKEEKPKENMKTNATKKKQPKREVKPKEAKKLKTVIKPQIYVYEEPHQPQTVEHHLGASRSGGASAPEAPNNPPPPPPPSACMNGCAQECAPACTPQCCALETAPPPEKEPAPPVEKDDKKVKWMERAHYEPGPNYPPPPIPALVIEKVIPPKTPPPPKQCASTCERSSCAPACLPTCCHPKPILPQVVGCARNCTPRTCVLGCPLHCCARYIKRSKIMSAYHKARNEKI